MARQRTEEMQGLRDMIRQLQSQVAAMEDQHMEMDMENAELRIQTSVLVLQGGRVGCWQCPGRLGVLYM